MTVVRPWARRRPAADPPAGDLRTDDLPTDDLLTALRRLGAAQARGEGVVHVALEGDAGSIRARAARLARDLVGLGHATTDTAVVGGVAVLTVHPARARPGLPAA